MSPKLAPTHLALLPGLDGTGDLFAHFLSVLPTASSVTVVRYLTDKFLAYDDLVQVVRGSLTQTDPVVVLAESFSTPIAIKYAAMKPPKLAGIVLCAGFVSNPVPRWSWLAKLVARPWLLTLPWPRVILE